MAAHCDLKAKRNQLKRIRLTNLEVRGEVFRLGGYLRVRAYCSACKSERVYLVDNLLRGRTTRCSCQRSVKYGRSPLAVILGARFDALMQRHGRGSCCRFKSREEFVRYMLELASKHNPPIKTAVTLRRYRIERRSSVGYFSRGNVEFVAKKGRKA